MDREDSRDSVCHGAARVWRDRLTGACASAQVPEGADPAERVLRAARLLTSQPVVLTFLPSLEPVFNLTSFSAFIDRVTELEQL